MSKVHYQSRKRMSKNYKHSKHGKLDHSVFHHESTPRDPMSLRRSIRPPSTADMLKVINNSPRPKSCNIYFHMFLCFFSVCLSIPELTELQWWEDISSTAKVLSWGPFAVVLGSLVLTTFSLCCTNRAFMFLAVIISFVSLPLVMAQLAVCSTPAVLTLCCCFPSQCLLSLTHVTDRLSDHVRLNETCREFVPVRRNDYNCASSRSYFILFWISCSLTLIFTSFLVTAQWYWIRSPSWKFIKKGDILEDGEEYKRIKVFRNGHRRPSSVRLKEYHQQEDDENIDLDEYFTSEEEEEEREEKRRHRRKRKKKRMREERRNRRRKRKEDINSNDDDDDEIQSGNNDEEGSEQEMQGRQKNKKRGGRRQGESNQYQNTTEDARKARAVMRLLSARKSESESSISSEESSNDIPPNAPMAPTTMKLPPSVGGAAAAIKAKLAAARSKDAPTGSQFFSPRETLQSSNYQNQ